MLKNILSFDFETVPNGKTYHIGAVFNGKTFQKKNIKDLKSSFNDLVKFAQGADYILGHNIVNHDLLIFKNVFQDDLTQRDLSGADFLSIPVIDTLFLSPLAFPENPYHKLIKNYKLIKASKNDPIADAKLANSIFEDQRAAFLVLNETEPDLISFFAFAFALENTFFGNENTSFGNGKKHANNSKKFKLKGIFDLFYSVSEKLPDLDEAENIFKKIAKNKVCETGLKEIWEKFADNAETRPMLAYVLSWIRVSGGNSIIPPWVKHEFHKIREVIQKLRYSCADENCRFCREHNDSENLLKKYFGFEKYRVLSDGRPLQKEVTKAILAGDSLLGILPTGGGKSICYQIPALHRHERLGELTIVISPLKALMKDQVDNLNRVTGTETAAAINGSLTLPERGAVMEKVRLGDIGLLYISPEQLRNYSIAELIKTRDVGCWVFDEAHCLSKWGHDFRPDYLNVSAFIADYTKVCGHKITAPVGAFTATAKKDVVDEILSHFKDKLSIDLQCFIGGVQRENLSFQVWPVTENEKFDIISNCLKETLNEKSGGAIVYCSSRRQTENLSAFLNEKGISSQAFHAGRTEPDKRNIQDDFVMGNIPVICATNAFGMGIDKKDIRLVIHADIPGSLENYLQEAGRAGRDNKPSECILLYEQEDIENQFSLNAYSKLSIKDIKKILKILKKRGAETPEIIITPGEIMRLIGYRDSDNVNDARARTGVAWLEKKGFLERSFNRTLFFTGTPVVKDMDEAAEKIEKLSLSKTMKAVFITILMFLFNAEKNQTISADDICASLGRIEKLPEKYFDSREIISLLSDMAEAGLIREGVVMTAFVKPKGSASSLKISGYLADVEKQIIDIMEEMAPESWLDPDRPDVFNIRLMSQLLKDKGFDNVNSDTVEKILRSIANDKGKNLGKSMKITGRKGMDKLNVYVKFPWQDIRKRVALRHQASRIILDAIIERLPLSLRKGQAEVLSQFFISDIMKAFAMDLFLSQFTGDTKLLIETSLLYMHDVKIITLQNGLGVFRQAMTLVMLPESRKRRYTKGDYEPLSHHYAQKNVQVHVMEKFAKLGLTKIKTALNFVSDYFSSSCDAFINRYFPGKKEIIQTAMTEGAYKKIIQSLENDIQEAVVAAPLEKNILVLAGPGSGKTKIIVHRCAWLIKAKSIDPSSILILCFNHQTMLELRRRIKKLAGKSANFVTAMTYHGFAMRLAGRSFVEKPFFGSTGSLPDFTGAVSDSMSKTSGSTTPASDSSNSASGSPSFVPVFPGSVAGSTPPATGTLNFNNIIDEALEILNGDRPLPGVEPSEAREYLLASYRYILVDEYQDIDESQYRFISALTGRLEKDGESKISIMAVGDDDQSIYGFRNASTEFIQQFKIDYSSETFYLVENYRSSYSIIQASASLIALNKNRMKKGIKCRINKKRKALEQNPSDIEEAGLVKIVLADDIASQAVFVAEQIKAIMLENPGTCAGDFAVISRRGISYPVLVAVRMALARENIDFSYSIKNSFSFPIFKIREFQKFIHYLDEYNQPWPEREDRFSATICNEPLTGEDKRLQGIHTKTKSIRPRDLKQEILSRFDKKNTYVKQIEQILESWCAINNDTEIPVSLAKNFVLETLLEERREHKAGTGVFIGTVHSVKGMEFPFVFILDGGWKHGKTREYIEEETRLFYVGMTRARQRLFLCSIKNVFNPHIKSLKANDFIYEIKAKPSCIPQFSNELTVSILGMTDLYLDFPGFFSAEHEIHKNLSKLETGEKVRLKEVKNKVYIVNGNEDIIALMSKKGIKKWKPQISNILNARVLGIVRRKYREEDKKYSKKIKTKSWELPIVEILHNGNGSDLVLP